MAVGEKIIDLPVSSSGKKVLKFRNAKNQFARLKVRPSQPIVWAALTRPLPRVEHLKDAPQSILDRTTPVPFLIDTGCSEFAVCHQSHFSRWLCDDLTGSKDFKPFARIALNGHPSQKVRSSLWIFKSLGNQLGGQPKVTDPSIKVEINGCVVSTIDSGIDYIAGSKNSIKKPNFIKRTTIALFTQFSRVNQQALSQESVQLAAQKYIDDDDIDDSSFPRLPLIGTKAIEANNLCFAFDAREPGSARFTITKPS